MSRVKIEEPNEYLFKAKIITRITDLNYGGHVGNDRIFAFMHDARVQFIKSLGYSGDLNFDGIGTIQTDAAISYKAEVFAHEELKIEVGVKDLNKYGCDFVYRFKKADEKIAAIGKTGIIFFDYNKRKIVNMPEAFRKKIA
jgi:YbgC/YbaW family acyl-CoA thioester hydrolase